MRLILGFPGQGSQKAKIGQLLATKYPDSAGRVFRVADEVLDGLFSKVVWAATSDAAKELSATENTQPIVLATSIATLEALKQVQNFEITSETTACLVGHSLGEFSCLVASGSIGLEDALRIVRRRGEAMQKAADRWGRTPAMSAVLGLSWEAAKEIQLSCPPGLLVEAAAANGKEQTVLSGCDEGVAWGIDRAKKLHGAKRALKVNVSCPFHSTVMRVAAEEFTTHLMKTKLMSPSVPICFGFDASVRSSPSEIRDALLKGMYSPVLWADAVRQASSQFSPDNGAPLLFKEMGGETLRFGVSDVPGLHVGKPVRALPEDIAGFSREL